MPYSPEVTAFWRGYKIFIDGLRHSLGSDFIALNYDNEDKPEGSISLYFRAFNVAGTLFDGPHIGYQTGAREVVFYVPKPYCDDDDAMNMIKASCTDLNKAGERCSITVTKKAGTVKLIIEITPIDITRQPFQDCKKIVDCSYDKVVMLYRIARKAFPGLR
ncbi:MAG: hypothetical protein GX937_05080 [Lentisphaerae bacterium]|nr:hypothetical protein [Lentisphaerota bacterium]